MKITQTFISLLKTNLFKLSERRTNLKTNITDNFDNTDSSRVCIIVTMKERNRNSVVLIEFENKEIDQVEFYSQGKLYTKFVQNVTKQTIEEYKNTRNTLTITWSNDRRADCVITYHSDIKNISESMIIHSMYYKGYNAYRWVVLSAFGGFSTHIISSHDNLTDARKVVHDWAIHRYNVHNIKELK